jgi:DNA-damage-inducible protein J
MAALQNEVIRTRVNSEIKAQASIILEGIGLTMSDAIRLMVTRIAREKALPFEPLIPNDETLQAIKEARAGITKPFDSVDDLMADLNA